jgi:hypothetical protein
MRRSEYVTVHNWIRKQKGEPTHCEKCGIAPPDIAQHLLHWSNISDMYMYDVTDWQMLCDVCHSHFDGPRTIRKTNATVKERYGVDGWYEFQLLPTKEKERLYKEWRIKEATMYKHPLEWSERELAWMVRQNTINGKVVNVSSIYRNMGYRGKVVPQSFKERIRKVQEK